MISFKKTSTIIWFFL